MNILWTRDGPVPGGWKELLSETNTDPWHTIIADDTSYPIDCLIKIHQQQHLPRRCSQTAPHPGTAHLPPMFTRSSAVAKSLRYASCMSLASLQYVDRKFGFRFNTAYCSVFVVVMHAAGCDKYSHWCVVVGARRIVAVFVHRSSTSSINSQASYRRRSRFVPSAPAFDAPVRGVPSDYCHGVWYGKTRMVWLPDAEKNIAQSCTVFQLFDSV